jgi:long-chain acyl-CoA synthetase
MPKNPHPMTPNAPLRTVTDYFYHWERTTPDAVYLRQPVGEGFRDYTWAEVGDQARRMAAYLRSLGLPPGSNVGLVSKNCAHWIIADLAIGLAGHVSVPFYPTLTGPQLRQVLEHSGCPVLFVGKLDEWAVLRDGVPETIRCIAFPAEYDGSPADELDEWYELLADVRPMPESPQPDLDLLQTIVYTSGTTGQPKGVMIPYRASAEALRHTTDWLGLANPPGPVRFFSYLPLCHIAERSLVESGSLVSGGTIYFAESLDTFPKNLQAARPTHFLAVPRIWTKFQMGILAKMPPEKLDRLLKIPVLNWLVKRKIRQGLGLDKARMLITGAAPMPTELIRWYERLGLRIQEAYGMTENLGGHTFSRPDHRRLGTVGQLYPGVETRIDPETGEVQMRCPWMTTGYYREPGLTAGLLRDGWLCTGDMGELTTDGYLKITGRVKDMFKTAKGEYVVPAPIEFGFATNAFVEQVCVAGATLPQPIALVVLSDLGRQAERTAVARSLAETVQAVNPGLKHYEHLKKVVVVRDAWTVDNNLLTPTMKIKRNVVETRYQPAMDRWYGHDELVVWEEEAGV